MSAPPADRTRSGMALGAAIAAAMLAVLALVAVNVKYDPDTAGGGGGGDAAAVPVTMADYSFSPNAISAGVDGTLALTNTGTQVHNLEVEGTGVKSPDIAADGSAQLALSGIEPGDYVIFCNLPGHRDQGMEGTLAVSEGGSETLTVAEGEDGSLEAVTSEEDWAASDEAMVEGTNAYVQAAVEQLTAGEDVIGVPTEGIGNQKLEPEILADGTKKFVLEGAITKWEKEPGVVVDAWSFNGTVPGPWIRVEPGDKVQVDYVNNTPAGSDIHWHGISTPFLMDGVAPITQDLIPSGETFTYEFTAPDTPQLGMYHPHNHGHVAVVNGMWGVFQIGDVPLPRGETISGESIPADLVVDQEIPMVLNDSGVIGLTLNGKGFPATAPIVASVGDWVLVHYYNEGLMSHPMHLHKVPQLVVAKDGFPLDSPYWADTVNVAPGERYSVLMRIDADDTNDADPAAPAPGIWAYHCHILSHAENDNGLFGMVTALVVLPSTEESAT